MNDIVKPARRNFLKSAGLLLGSSALPAALAGKAYAAPAIITAEGARPAIKDGLQIGDAGSKNAVIWSRTDRPARLFVEYDYTPDFANPRQVRGPYALDDTDYTARVALTGLPRGRQIFVRATFQDLSNERVLSEPLIGMFTTASRYPHDIRFVWSGDTAGQGWGINPEFGGMRIYETMRKLRPDFFIHSGDTIYADGPIMAEQTAEDGRIWRNVVTEEVSKVAETLKEFRGRYKYNLLDENVRRFNAEVPQIWQWDDHEVTNNWSPGKDLSADARYTVKDIPLLVARGTKAFLEYAPLRTNGIEESERIYRKISYGPLLDVFVIDMRSYRGPNTFNRQTTESAETAFLGYPQIEWLKQGLRKSRALWKVIASDMPLGLIVGDGMDAQGRPRFENSANSDGPVLGREFEIAALLRAIKHERIKNVVWFTADVHYCAAHYYDPNKAQFQDFEPFWEFVSGPLNAGSFGPGVLENTFGPQLVFQKFPPKPNTSPYAGLQFFGEVNIDAYSGVMRVNLKDIDDVVLFSKALDPVGSIHRHDEEDDSDKA
ncbi:MAG: alkaline phosphatase D family protein [Pseudomonadota bacterium]|nr:alkaline phosphatase D family protein [Pseudomonadota bacterium]